MFVLNSSFQSKLHSRSCVVVVLLIMKPYVLASTQDSTIFQKRQHSVFDTTFHKFTGDTSERNGPIIARITRLSLLKNGNNRSKFPDVRNYTLLQR